MAIEVKLQAFEGPLDLLLHLIDKNKVSIYDIPISLITEQYLQYLSKLKEQLEELDTMSEFLVMAATLLSIKSRMLLPKKTEEEGGEEEDPREELVRQLLEYKTYKFMSSELREMEDQAGGVWYRSKSLPREVSSYRPKVDPDEILDQAGVTLPGLYKIFQEVMRRREDLKDPIRSGFGKIEREEVDTRETMRFVEQYIMSMKKCTFRSLLGLRNGKMFTVVSFLTILELMKIGHISVLQEETFGEITIEARDPSEWNEESLPEDEWAEASERGPEENQEDPENQEAQERSEGMKDSGEPFSGK